MSRTLRIVDGDIAILENLGIPELVEGIEKGAQDVARHLLSEFDDFFDEGNELLTSVLDGASLGFSEGIVTQFLYEAMSRLIIKQRNSNTPNRIIKTNQIKVRVIDLTTVVFLIEVLFETGETVSVVDQFSARQVQLNHLINPGGLLRV